MIQLEKYTVIVGKIVITSQPALITTILGSCVAVCLWNKVSKIAGMNHFLLPGENGGSANQNYGVTSTRTLVESMLKENNIVLNLEAKIFGGCNSLYKTKNLYRIGERNVVSALQVLADYDIPIVAHHIGGSYGRKIVFNSTTGKVRMRMFDTPLTDLNNEDNKGFGY